MEIDNLDLTLTKPNASSGYYASLLIVGIAVIIVADLFLHAIPSWIFASIIFAFHVFYCNKYENAFIIIQLAPIIAGAIFISRGISGIGGFFIPLGLILIWKDIYEERNILLKSYVPLLLIFILFGFSAYLNEGGDYYTTKLLNTITYGTLTYISFSVLLINRRSVRFPLVAMFFLIYSIFMLRLVIDINNIPGPSNLFHFGFMREQTLSWVPDAFIDPDDFTIVYHQPGFFALLGLSLFLTDSEKCSKALKLFVWILAFIIVFYAGARQNFIAYFILLIFFILSLDKYSKFYKYLAIGIIGLVFILILLSINSDAIQNIIYSKSLSGAIEESGRSELINKGLELFNNNPYSGVGFGHFEFEGIFDTYPHNSIVELLAEVGIFGLAFMVLISGIVILKDRKELLLLHKNNFKPYLLFLPLLVRTMVSGNMTLNIIVFSLLFSLSCLAAKIRILRNSTE